MTIWTPISYRWSVISKQGTQGRAILFFPIVLSFIISGCENIEKKKPITNNNILKYIHASKSDLPGSFSLKVIQSLIHNGNLQEASRYVNIALSCSSKNALLHIINGFIYEEMTKSGYGSYTELAEIAYTSAYNLDCTQWYVVYLYGRYLLKKGDYLHAQKLLSEALLLNPNNTDVLYCLAYSAYHNRDIKTALASIIKTVSINKKNPSYVRSAVIIYASAGNLIEAKKYLNLYSKMVGKKCENDIEYLSKRIIIIDNEYKKAKLKLEASKFMNVMHPELNVGPGSEQNSSGEDFQKESEDEMLRYKEERNKAIDFLNTSTDPNTKKAERYVPILMECYIFSIIENYDTSKGSNILDTFADNISLSDSSAKFDKQYSSPVNPPNNIDSNDSYTQTDQGGRIDGSNQYQKTFTLNINDQNIKYNLNIANAIKKKIEIIGRPTIVTMLGEKATLMSGTQVLGGSTEGAFGQSLQGTDVGIKVDILPINITEKNKVLLNITISGSEFGIPPDSGRAINAQTFSIEKSKTSTTVKAAFDQTVLIAGLFQHIKSSGTSRVPILGSIPILQYFFCSKQTFNKIITIFFLITPKRGMDINKTTKNINLYKIKNKNLSEQLESRGIITLGETNVLEDIIIYLNKRNLFSLDHNDLLSPDNCNDDSDLEKNIEKLASFLYF